MSAYAFLSYHHGADARYVDRLARHLESAAIDAWYDREIVHGDRWTRVIREKLDGCSAFVVVMTPEAEESEWVDKEVARALLTKRPILPLLLRGQRFFTLGTVQYEDVVGGLMPGTGYLARLRSILGSRSSGQLPTLPPSAGRFPPAAGLPAPAVRRAVIGTAAVRGRHARSHDHVGSVRQRFERRLGNGYDGPLDEVFKGVVHPVEILAAMQREAGAHKAIVAWERFGVANRYVIELSPFDHRLLVPHAADIVRELARSQAEFIGEEGWTVHGDVTVEIERGDGLDTGMFQVISDVYSGDESAAALTSHSSLYGFPR